MSGNNQQENLFEIKDIAISAFLYSTDLVKLVGKRRIPTGELFFQFAPKEKAEELAASYWNQNAPLIQPKKLFSAQRDLKDMIFGS